MALPSMLHVIILIVILVLCDQCVVGIEPITTAMLGFAGLAGLYTFSSCRYLSECCDEHSIKFRPNELEESFNSHVYGQHLATQAVLGAMKGHLSEPNPKKALVFSFSGWTGTGKNWIANFIADSMFVKKRQSRFRHTYFGATDFPHADMVKTYKDRLHMEVMAAIKECPRSLFIFDEVEKIPSGVLDALSTFLDTHDEVDGTNYRQAVYIFLSNIGGSDLANVAFKFWSEGLKREDIKLTDVESLLTSAVYSSPGGLNNSYIIDKSLIDFYVPFLPLEEEHVKLCIMQYLQKKNLACTDEFISLILENLNYFPPEIKLYSKTGCKTVNAKVDSFLHFPQLYTVCPKCACSLSKTANNSPVQ